MAKIGKSGAASIDVFDRAILKIVQIDNLRSHADIGAEVGLSGSAVRRRLTRLRDAGFIRGDVSLIAPEAIGETLIVTIYFGEESLEAYAAFEKQMRDLPQVQQCYHVAGEADFILIVHVSSLQMYEDWAKAEFMSNAAIRRYDTTVVWSCKKFETALPV